MKVVLCLLVLGGVLAQPPPNSEMGSSGSSSTTEVGSPNSTSEGLPPIVPASTSGSATSTTSEATHASSSTTAGSASVPWASTPDNPDSSGSFGSGPSGSAWGSVGSDSGWQDAGWGYDVGWNSREQWHFQPMWYWNSPYPPDGTTYQEDWGYPPSRDVGARRSFYFGAGHGVSLAGATTEPGRADCSQKDWCVHLTFHSSYGVLTDFDAFVLDRYDSASKVYGEEFYHARSSDNGPPRFFAPMVLGGFSLEERAVLKNMSDGSMEDMVQRFNETRTTTWTLYPDSDELDAILSFKQLFTLLPGYPDGNTTASKVNNERFSEWGPSDQVLLRIAAKREGSGATSALLPRVLNFTGSQLFEVEYFSSLEYPDDDDDNETAAPNAMTLDVVFNRRRYGSRIPWNPAKPSDVCDACGQRAFRHPIIARCLQNYAPEHVFKSIMKKAATDLMEWDRHDWDASSGGDSFSYNMNDAIDACLGLPWLLKGLNDDGSWSSDSSRYGDAGEGRASSSSSGPVYNDAGYAFGDTGLRWSSSGSSGGPDAGDLSSIQDFGEALAFLRESDTGIQCLVESRCPIGDRNFAEAAGRMVVIEHDPATIRVVFNDSDFEFYIWMELEGLGQEGQFTTPPLGSDYSPDYMAGLITGSVPNASEYNMAVDVRLENNLEWIEMVKMFNEWLMDYYKAGGSAYEASSAWSSHSASSGGKDFQFQPGGKFSTSGSYSDAATSGTSKDGSSLDARDEDNSAPWVPELYPVPDLQYIVEISFRNISIIPNILDIIAITDESTVSAATNMTWNANGSNLRFQLAPLNLSSFQYVPPPPDLNLTWNEEVSDHPDDSSSGDGNTPDLYGVCSECQDAFTACDSNTSCSIGVRAFLEEALYYSRFTPQEGAEYNSSSSRHKWILGNFGPRLRQSASFFTADGYDLFMNFMTCISTNMFACNLDLPRQVRSASRNELLAADPTLLEITPAYSVFIIPSTTTGGMDNIVMKYRGKEHLFKWSGESKLTYTDDLSSFISEVVDEYDPNENLWPRNPLPAQGSSIKVSDVSKYYSVRDTSTDDSIIKVSFKDYFFIEDEPPRFKPQSSDIYNELNSSHWKAVASAYRNPNDETIWDKVPEENWQRFAVWLGVLGGDPNYSEDFSYGSESADEIPLCHQCMNSWEQCFFNKPCRYAMRESVLPTLWDAQGKSTKRSSLDFSAKVAEWQSKFDAELYRRVTKLLSCLSLHSCPVGYALPADPVASLVATSIKTVSSFAVTFPWQKYIQTGDDTFDFGAFDSSARELEDWLLASMPNGSAVDIQTSMTSGMAIRFEVTCDPALSEFPTFYLKSGGDLLELENPITFASFDLSSNLVQRDQSVSWDLLHYWFGLPVDSEKMFYASGDIFSGTQVCHECPMCWEALTRCRNNMDCATSSIEALVPLLRNAALPISTSQRTDGRKLVELDLSSVLLSLENDAFLSREGWLAFAHLLHSLSTCGCEVGFGQTNFDTGVYLEPTKVHIKSEFIELSVRIYSDTELEVWFSGNVYSYYPSAALPISEAIDNFNTWFSSVIRGDPVHLNVEESQIMIDDESHSATITMKLTELDDQAKSMINPTWIPTFKIKSEDMSAMPPAEVNVTPWEISLQSTDRYPPFDRLLDLLVYGAVPDETSTSNSGSPDAGSSHNSSSSSGDECSRCEEQRQACFDDVECSSALRNTLLPTVRSMYPSNDGTGSFWFDASGQILDGVFQNMQTLDAKQKMLTLLQCSAISTSTTQGSCVQKLSKEAVPGVTASLEIIQATSTFLVSKGTTASVSFTTSDTIYRVDNGDPTELASFIENEVLGGYAASGVHVWAYVEWNALEAVGTYTIVYGGLTALSTPHLSYEDVTPRVDSADVPMKTKFQSSIQDLTSVFSLWANWLDPTLV